MIDSASSKSPTPAAPQGAAPAPQPAPDPTLTSISTHVGAVVAGVAAAFLTHKAGLDSATASALGSQLGNVASMAIGAMVTTGWHYAQAWLAANAAKAK